MWLTLTIYSVGLVEYWFIKIKVSSYTEKLIIIDDLACLQYFSPDCLGFQLG